MQGKELPDWAEELLEKASENGPYDEYASAYGMAIMEKSPSRYQAGDFAGLLMMKIDELQISLNGMTEARDRFCHWINIIAEIAGMPKRGAVAPEAVNRAVMRLKQKHKEDLPERLMAIRETVSEWDAPITAQEDLEAAASELKHTRILIKEAREVRGYTTDELLNRLEYGV